MARKRTGSIGWAAFVIAVLGCGQGRSCNRPGPETGPVEEATALREPVADGAPERSLTLWLGGDVHLGATEGDGLAPVARELSGALGIVNLEGPVGPGAAASTASRLVNAPDSLAMLARHGVAVAGIANNHAGDLGPAGIAATRRALAALAIEPAGDPGHGRDGSDDGVALIERDGLRVAVSAHDLSGGVPEDLAARLTRARARGDILVAWFHILAPPLYTRRPELRQAVDVALDAGATIIAAHGSHAIARVERRGSAVIVWGLGNLLFACSCSRETEGVIVRVELGREGVGEAQVIPIDAGLSGAPATMAAEPGVTLDVLESLGSSPWRRAADRAHF